MDRLPHRAWEREGQVGRERFLAAVSAERGPGGDRKSVRSVELSKSAQKFSRRPRAGAQGLCTQAAVQATAPQAGNGRPSTAACGGHAQERSIRGSRLLFLEVKNELKQNKLSNRTETPV